MLHIGEILVPEAIDGSAGSPTQPKSRHSLKPGEVAVIVSRETLDLPAHLSAFGFPPPKVSSFGCFMTNPGHVDPGYKGPLRFTLINLGRDDFVLVEGDPIFVLLVVELSGAAKRSWIDRRGGTEGRKPNAQEMSRLPADFLDVDRRAEGRAEAVAKKLIDDAELRYRSVEFRIKWYGALWTAVPAVLVGMLVSFGPLATKTSVEKAADRVQKLETELERLKAVASIEELREAVRQLQKNSQP